MEDLKEWTNRLESVKHLKGKDLQGMPLYALLDSNRQLVQQGERVLLGRKNKAVFGTAQEMLFLIDDRVCFIQPVVPADSATVSRVHFNGCRKSSLLFSVHNPDKNLILTGAPLPVREALLEMMREGLFLSNDLDKALYKKFLFPDTFHTACLLVELGADIHTDDGEPLRDAFLSGNESAVRFLMEHGAQLPDSRNGEDPFYEEFFFENGRPGVGCLRLLFKYGMDVHYDNDALLRGAGDDLWSSASAADTECCEKLRLLLEHGADIHAGNEEALRDAIQSQHLRCVQLLLENGASFSPDMISGQVLSRRMAELLRNCETWPAGRPVLLPRLVYYIKSICLLLFWFLLVPTGMALLSQLLFQAGSLFWNPVSSAWIALLFDVFLILATSFKLTGGRYSSVVCGVIFWLGQLPFLGILACCSVPSFFTEALCLYPI